MLKAVKISQIQQISLPRSSTIDINSKNQQTSNSIENTLNSNHQIFLRHNEKQNSSTRFTIRAKSKLTMQSFKQIQNNCKNSNSIEQKKSNDDQTKKNLQETELQQIIFPDKQQIDQQKQEKKVRNSFSIGHKHRPPKNLLIQSIQQTNYLEEFLLGGVIGRGSYAIVRSGTNQNDDSKVAVKIYDKIKLHDPLKKQNLQREISILQKMDHSNIIKMIKVIETKYHINLVLQYGGQISLKHYFKQRKQLQEQEVRNIMKGLFSAVSYLHSKHIIHRDIKLENILLDDSRQLQNQISSFNRIKLIDFGFAILHEFGQKMKMFCGTPSYMAPEIVIKSQNYNEKVDVWACGIVMYYLLTGIYPFKGENEKELYKKIQDGKFKKSTSISNSAMSLIEKLLNINRNFRITADQALSDSWLEQTSNLNTNEQKRYQYLLLDN